MEKCYNVKNSWKSWSQTHKFSLCHHHFITYHIEYFLFRLNGFYGKNLDMYFGKIDFVEDDTENNAKFW